MAHEISGHFFRGAERWVIVVEQPYPKQSATSERSTEITNPDAISEGSSQCGEVVPLTSAGPCSKSRKL
jgi:hypothetical protein